MKGTLILTLLFVTLALCTASPMEDHSLEEPEGIDSHPLVDEDQSHSMKHGYVNGDESNSDCYCNCNINM